MPNHPKRRNLEFLIDMMRLRKRFSQFKNFSKSAREIRKKLLPYYKEYIAGVSSDEMTISLELSVFLLVACNMFKPKSILDLGSGFSSFVFRWYHIYAIPKPIIWSIDNDPKWLEKTREFLISHNLSVENLITWSSFMVRKNDSFDLILHDLGSWELRKKTLENVLSLSHLNGIIILDDLHKEPYGSFARQTLDRHNLKYYSLRSYTRDKFGRYSALVAQD